MDRISIPILDTPAKDLFDRPVIIEPVGDQLLSYCRQKCRYATWISLLLFVISIPTIPGTFLASCALFSKPYGSVELFIVLNAFVYMAVSPLAIYAGRTRNKDFYYPAMIYTLAVCMFMFVPIIGGLETLKMTSTLFTDAQAQIFFIFMEGLLGVVWIYWNAIRAIHRYDEYSTTGVLLL